MAKIKVRPHPGALSELLKRKGMTQTDAFEKTRVDRKTLLKIDRGEEVKLETLQQVATKLQITEEYFRHPPAAEVEDCGDIPSLLEPSIMLRQLDAARLEELLKGAAGIRWILNAQVREEEARKFLEEFEQAVENFREHLQFPDDPHESPSLRLQLDRLKTADDIAARLEWLVAEYRLALFGSEYLFWECTCEDGSYEDHKSSYLESYRSSRKVLLSVEPFGTHSRRATFFPGTVPPKYPPDIQTSVFVNGVQLTGWDGWEEDYRNANG